MRGTAARQTYLEPLLAHQLLVLTKTPPTTLSRKKAYISVSDSHTLCQVWIHNEQNQVCIVQGFALI